MAIFKVNRQQYTHQMNYLEMALNRCLLLPFMDKCPHNLEVQEHGRGHRSQENLQRKDAVDFSEKGWKRGK